jgi:hypothetical protein
MVSAVIKIVTPGFGPGVHFQKQMMDGRGKPGHDC